MKATRIALAAAAVVALGAIVHASLRQDEGVAAAPAAVSAPSAASADPEALIRALQEQVGANPGDAAGWQRLGQAYFLTERYADAERAYRRAVGLTPTDAGLWSSYGEATVMASERDPMPPIALEAFRKAKALDAKEPRARYFLAVARDLSGDHKGAIDDWLVLLADTPAGAAWEADLRRTVEQVGKINGIDVASRIAAVKPAPAPAAAMHDPVATGPIPGPSREQMQAASAMPKGAQAQMVAGMVSGLEAKLKANPANVDGWIMLMRSRMTLGETAKAVAARDAGIAANPAAAARIRSAAGTLGLPGS
ncbi:MAG: tetratricopeptide repeat protein [Sphingobium sp.]